MNYYRLFSARHVSNSLTYLTKNLLLVLVLTGTHLMAQQTVNGTVSDAQGPIPGATIVVQGSNIGVTSDFDGNFSIEANPGDVLEISHVGLLTQQYTVLENQDTIEVLLELDNRLEEVVVTGYGTQRKSDVTGAITSLKSESFNQGVVTNPGQLLQGKISGVNVTATSGEPGASQNIIIRGIGSLRSGTTPLFVVDGFIIDNSAFGVSNPLNFINPQDIASIDVLKDASASAIYGARAANGVIVITTKKGKLGKTEMNFSVSTAMANIANSIDVFSASEFRKQVPTVGGTLLDGGANTNWQDALTRTAASRNINFSMSGSVNEKLSYYTSFGVDNQEGVFNNSELDRYSGRLNLNQKAWEGKLNIDLNLNATRNVNQRPNIGDSVIDMLQLNPTFPIYTNGQPTVLQERLNPIVRNQIYNDEIGNNRILANFSPSLEIIDGLTYKLNLGVDYSSTNQDRYYRPYDQLEGSEDGSLYSRFTLNSNMLIENTITYNLDMGVHKIILLGGHSYQEATYSHKIYESKGFANNGIDPRYQDQISSDVLPTTMDGSAYLNEQESFFGRVNYGYDDKYLLTATLRADGSSKFGANNKYGYFPSVAFGWNITNEDFMTNNENITNLKLRASWGQTGNQDGIPSKVSLASYKDSKSDNDTYPLNGTESSIDDYPYGTVPVRTPNPSLKWEVSTQFNVGLDFALFDAKLSGTIDYFNKVAEDVVLYANKIDPIQPTSSNWTNIENMEIKNSGIEISLNYSGNIGSEVNFDIGGNLSSIKNEVANSPFEILTTGAATGAGQTGATINGYMNGQPIGTFYMKEFMGIGSDGLSIYKDIVADGESLDNDRAPMGTALPDMLYAFYFNLKYRSFDFGLNFNGVSGNKIFNHTAMSLFSTSQLSRNLNTSSFAAQYPNEDISNANEVSTRYLEDGSYLRLNNATLGYNINPQSIGLGDYMSSIRISATGQNLFVLTDYSGFDPEVNTGSDIGGIQTFGIDRFTYPTPRTVLLGLNVSF
jgi:TonB-linked SusC/RagA family outer membrane protein